MSGVLLLAQRGYAIPPGWAVKSPLGISGDDPGHAAFVSWLHLFLQVARGAQHVAYVDRCMFPLTVAQRRMVHRLALAYAVATPRAQVRWPLGGGLGAAPAQGPWDTLAAPLGPSGLGLGARRPVAVLVGDRPQPGAPRWAAEMGWPFISGLRTGCSAWIAETLDAGGIAEESLLWINARRQSGEVDLRAMQRIHDVAGDGEDPQVPLVIALGRHASKALDEAGTPHEEVHHPQHWKRFHHGEPYYLPRLIRKHIIRQRRAA